MQAEALGVVLYGFGRVGRATLELALRRPWLEVRGIVARSPSSEGVVVAREVEGAPPGLVVSTDARLTLRRATPDVVLVATRSAIPDVLPHLHAAVDSGARAVLTTAEEMAHPDPDDPAIRELLAAAERQGCAIVATGVNPGFVLDLWPLVLSGLAWDVASLHARRVVDVSVFAPHTRVRLGIGHTPEQFERGLAEGAIAGHVGFPESLRILAEAMGHHPERITVETLPVVAERRYVLADGAVEPGTTVGARQRAVAWLDGRPWMTIEMLLHAAPAADGIATVDETRIEGRHPLHVVVDPGCGAILSTAAQLVNGIGRALQAPPGIHGPGDLPPSAPWLAVTPPVPRGVSATPSVARAAAAG